MYPQQLIIQVACGRMFQGRPPLPGLSTEEKIMEEFECIELNDVEQVSVVKFVDEKVMDPNRIEKMGKELMSLTDDKECQENVLINFENVKFFSSAAINKLIVLERRLKANGRAIRLSNLRPEVRDLFNFTNLDALFKIDSLQTDSIRAFSESE